MSRDQFVHTQNIERFRKLLAEAGNDERRRQIEKLLAEEEARDLDINKLHS